MSDELRIALPPETIETIAQRAAEIVLQRLVAEHDASEPPYLTVKQYAERHHTTPAAVRARIRRGKLDATVPPGGREYLLPNPDATEQAGGHEGYPDGSTKCPPRRWSVRGA